MKYIKDFIDSFSEKWHNKKYAECICIILFILGIVFSSVVLTSMLIAFITVNYEKIAIAVGAFFLIFYYIEEHFAEKKRAREEELALARKLQEEADADAIERNYRLVRNCLYSVLNDMSDVLGIKKPTNEGKIDSPHHTVRKLNFILYQYIVYPTASTVDTEKMRTILRQEISRRLDSHLFAGVSQTYYLHEGQAEPIISVYAVEDNNAYLTISVAIADENYCRHIRQGTSLNLLQQAEQIQATAIDDDF